MLKHHFSTLLVYRFAVHIKTSKTFVITHFHLCLYNYIFFSDLIPFQQDLGNNLLGQHYYSDNKGRDYFISMSHRNTMANRKCNIEGHPVVPIGENNMQRDCKYCQKYRIKTKRGWNVKTKFKCETCNVNLCSGDMTSRNCFVLYHEENVFGKVQSEMYISQLDTNMWSRNVKSNAHVYKSNMHRHVKHTCEINSRCILVLLSQINES